MPFNVASRSLSIPADQCSFYSQINEAYFNQHEHDTTIFMRIGMHEQIQTEFLSLIRRMYT